MNRRYRRPGVISCAVLVIACASCAGGAEPRESSSPEPVPSTSAATPAHDTRSVVLTTGKLTMVIDDGERPPQLCVGGVQESLPPQCAGVDLVGWDWGTAGEHDRRGGARWGEFIVTGEYVGADNALRVTSATSDGPDVATPSVACEDTPPRAAEVAEIASVWAFAEDALGLRVFTGGAEPSCGVVELTVAYDDGSAQRALDAEFGRGAVVVESALSRTQ